jgi:hypothetical protein
VGSQPHLSLRIVRKTTNNLWEQAQHTEEDASYQL